MTSYKLKRLKLNTGYWEWQKSIRIGWIDTKGKSIVSSDGYSACLHRTKKHNYHSIVPIFFIIRQ